MKEKIALLFSYIENQWNIIEKMLEKLNVKITNIKNRNEVVNEENTVFLSYNLHNIYSCFEEIFKQIAKCFENDINDYSQYHSELLKRMNIEIYKIRPKIISNKSYQVLNEIRKFRHVFRHAYEYQLDENRVIDISNTIINNFDSLKEDIKKFTDFLKDMID